MNIPGPKHPVHDCSILHYAYSSQDLRDQKRRMYDQLAPHLTKSEIFHAQTITTEIPHVKPLPFEPTWTLESPPA
jgi:hypothetical protein